jgi:hypothetical protein
MQAIPAAALIVVQPTLALRVFIELLDGPAAVGQRDQPTQRGVRRQITEVPLRAPGTGRSPSSQPSGPVLTR